MFETPFVDSQSPTSGASVVHSGAMVDAIDGFPISSVDRADTSGVTKVFDFPEPGDGAWFYKEPD